MNTTDLQALLEQHGENLLFMIKARPTRSILGIGFTSSSDPEMTVPAKLIERRYQVKNGYKVELEPTFPGFGVETFYMMDLANLINSDQVQVYVPAQVNQPA